MKRVLMFSASLALAAGSLSAQTADEIIARYQQAVGGAKRIAAVQTLRRTGKFYAGGGLEVLSTQESKRPNKVRSQITLQGMTMIQAYDGKTGRRVNPFQGKKDAEAMGEDEMKGIIQDAEFDDALFDYKQKGNTVQLLGTDEIEGSRVYKLQLTAADNGDVRTYYIDVDNNVPIKLEVKRTVRGAEQEFEIVYGDYKDVNGWYMPFAFEMGPQSGAGPPRARLTGGRPDCTRGRAADTGGGVARAGGGCRCWCAAPRGWPPRGCPPPDRSGGGGGPR